MRHEQHSDALHTINTRHPDQLLAIARAFGGHIDATQARAERIDAEGIELVLETPSGPAAVRVRFADPVVDYPDGVRVAFVRLARSARRSGPEHTTSGP